MKGNTVIVIHGFTESIKSEGLAKATVKSYLINVRKISRFCFKNRIADVKEFDESFVKSYVNYLHAENLSLQTRKTALSILKKLFEYCYDHELILSNPFERMSVVLRGEKKERKVFSEDQITRFLDIIKADNFIRSRDKSIFELLYGTGMRISEAVFLNIEDVDTDHREVIILHGKGGKQRIVPLCGMAYMAMVYWLKNYRMRKTEKDSKALYVSLSGKRIDDGAIYRNFKTYLKKSGLADKGFVPHSIRHSCATHMLDHGADIRYVQELLGHESIETTGIYTKQEKTKLKKLHKMRHPRENELYEE